MQTSIRRRQDSLMRVEGMSWPEAFAVAGFPGAGDSLVTFPAGTSPHDPTGWATLIKN